MNLSGGGMKFIALHCLATACLFGISFGMSDATPDDTTSGNRATAELPGYLSDTGLYAPGSTTVVRAENLPFSPQYPLWSDGAIKRRWLYLPAGATIDASNPDTWVFPPGTRLWKEFAHGRPVETRFIERLRDGSWRYASYVWNADGSDAVLAPADGVAALPVQAAPGGR